MRPRSAFLHHALLALVVAANGVAHAASATSGPSNNVPRTTPAVALNFAIQIDKFLFFRLGDGAWPTPGGTTSQVTFTLTPAIPGVPTTPVTGTNTSVNWNGAAPAFAVAAAGNVLQVEVRSNGGQVRLYATVAAPLTSGANTIPMSEIVVSSSDNANLPAPLIPASGNGPMVNVAGGGTGTANALATVRNANWTFSYANSASRVAGNYSGQVTFTATTP